MKLKIIAMIMLVNVVGCAKKVPDENIHVKETKEKFELNERKKRIPQGFTEIEWKRYIELQGESWKIGKGIIPGEGKNDIKYSAYLAERYRNQEKYKLAIKEYKRIIKTWGHIKEGRDFEIVARAVFVLGEIYYKELNDRGKALHYYKKLKKGYKGAEIVYENNIRKAEELAELRILEIEEKRKDNDK